MATSTISKLAHFTMLDKSALLIAILIIVSQYTEQNRVHCAVHGTCPRDEDFGVTQVIDTDHIGETDQIIRGMVEYFSKKRADPTTTVMMHEILDNCRNEDSNCAFWALLGECDKSPGFMKVSCAPVCQSCEKLSRSTRCPLDPNLGKQSVWKKGSVNQFFQNLTTLPENQRYEPKVASRPDFVDNDTAKTADYVIGPWVAYLDSFLSKDEADKLVAAANKNGFKADLDAVGSKEPDPQAPSGSWLEGTTYHDKVVTKIMGRIEKVTNIPQVNAENLQVGRYEKGQLHKVHHDYIYHQVERQPGVRILSIYLCLSDVEEGGENDFPQIPVIIRPKKGRAIFWSNVLDEDPLKRDNHVHHRTLVVEKGVKYGANVWIHQRDFKGPIQNNCH